MALTLTPEDVQVIRSMILEAVGQYAAPRGGGIAKREVRRLRREIEGQLITDPTVANSTLRSDGEDWVEDPTVRQNGIGDLDIDDDFSAGGDIAAVGQIAAGTDIEAANDVIANGIVFGTIVAATGDAALPGTETALTNDGASPGNTVAAAISNFPIAGDGGVQDAWLKFRVGALEYYLPGWRPT